MAKGSIGPLMSLAASHSSSSWVVDAPRPLACSNSLNGVLFAFRQSCRCIVPVISDAGSKQETKDMKVLLATSMQVTGGLGKVTLNER